MYAFKENTILHVCVCGAGRGGSKQRACAHEECMKYIARLFLAALLSLDLDFYASKQSKYAYAKIKRLENILFGGYIYICIYFIYLQFVYNIIVYNASIHSVRQ